MSALLRLVIIPSLGGGQGSHPKRLVVVELGSVEQATRPREDGSDGVRGGRVTLLVLSPVPCYRPVRRLRLYDGEFIDSCYIAKQAHRPTTDYMKS